MEFPLTIEDQAGFDALVKERLTRERAKYADYAQTKQDLVAAQEAAAASDKAIAEALSRAEKAEAELGNLKAAKQLDAWRAEVAAETKVPADALRGATREELAAHAAILAPLLAKGPTPVPSPGQQPDAPAETAELAAVRSLFGAND